MIITNFLTKKKDGGPDSPVDAFFLIEIKWLFTIALLRFNPGVRTVYHSHAFNAWTWFLTGDMREETLKLGSTGFTPYVRRWKPKFTSRERLHRVHAKKMSWCFTIRGPWKKEWFEFTPGMQINTLGHGHEVLKTERLDR